MSNARYPGLRTRARRILGAALLCAALFPFASAWSVEAKTELRCGWYSNPTPGNAFLIDADGTWAIASQMQANGPDAKGLDRLGALDSAERTQVDRPRNGDACACLKVRVRVDEKRIVKIESAKALPLRTCRADTLLPIASSQP